MGALTLNPSHIKEMTNIFQKIFTITVFIMVIMNVTTRLNV